MKVSYHWLEQISGVEADLDTLINKLTNIGLKLEDKKAVGNDISLDLEITVNRPDCLSHYGVAREIVTAFQLPPIVYPEIHPDIPVHVKETTGNYEDLTIILENPELCPRYCGQLLTGVKVGPSPNWLRERLEACEIRSINNVVDVTNYVMFELGQPLHAFDYDKLAGKTIRVRCAKNEKLLMIDGKERLLTETMLVIADAEKPQGVGGVMGGKESEVSDSTTNVLLESAYFISATIRKTRKALDLSTDASFRFERGVDPLLQDVAIRRAALLLEQIAGAKVHSVLDVNVMRTKQHQIKLRPERIQRILGEAVQQDFSETILTSLGFVQEERNVWNVPSYRVDIAREIDLIEEIARHFGYNNFPSTLPEGGIKYQEDYPTYWLERAVSQFLQGARVDEAVTLSFVNQSSPFVKSEKRIRILNPISETANELRNSLVPGLLESIDLNLRHRNRDVRLFEIGHTFHPAGEKVKLGIAMIGDYQDLKGIVEGALVALQYPTPEVKDGKIIVNEIQLGEINQYEIDGNTIHTCELSLSDLLEIPKTKTKYKPIIPYPPIERDLTFVINEQIQYSKMEDVFKQLAIAEIRSFKLIDRYQGKNTEPGKVNLTFRIIFQSENRTLLSEEVDALCAKIVTEFARSFDAELRK
jgi:phenylalanyl-tRNA synthetase beta chain